ncbi:hypothetical protein [Streptomyces violaceusniger]|uniref:Uncharacterized protein n=1 Tax=Streptomyces violaceusniger (strain Tu 4113) TaxID=653045 RepID=G2PHV6_STRV4|nr:hypothetical protein [Streptomyces violaceusniger]AEM88907.1 hypothetical protein Strvi_0131 [Streptomyces violaceusniger Tu 4113]
MTAQTTQAASPPRTATAPARPMSVEARAFMHARINSGLPPSKWGTYTWKVFFSLGGIT